MVANKTSDFLYWLAHLAFLDCVCVPEKPGQPVQDLDKW